MINKIEQILKSQIINELIENPIDRSKNNCYGPIAKEFNVSTEYIRSINRRLRNKGLVPETFTLTNNTGTHTTSSYEYKETRKPDGAIEIVDTVDRKLTDSELFERYGRKEEEWKISMVWFKDTQNGFKLSVCFIPLKKNQEIFNYQAKFLNYLDKVKPVSYIQKTVKSQGKTNSCLVLPNQDKHLNKFDIDGNNDIDYRFNRLETLIVDVVEKALTNTNLTKVIYIIGSDQFNSEWTGKTTKGTDQQNILDYNTSFEKICDFEIKMITYLAQNASSVEVVLLNGNHDVYAGWHLAHFLKAYFAKQVGKLWVHTEMDNTKVLSYGNSLMLFNHGDEMKFKDLASKFPIIAKNRWSFADNYYVFTGDKHFETASDINGIKCYQVPQLSNSKSNWDDKKGYITPTAEMVTFLIDEKEGLTDTYRKKI